MAKLENYNGSIEFISGLRQKGNASFPLMEANSIQTREDGTRLDDELSEIKSKLNTISENNTMILVDIATGVTYELCVINGKLTLVEQEG